MRRVIFNQKGGVGKSSIASNLSAISASYGYRTLLVDLDAQCNSSRYLLGDSFDNVQSSVGNYFSDVLTPGYSISNSDAKAYIYKTKFRGLHVLPASPSMPSLENLLSAKHKIYKLRELIDRVCYNFDAIYFDTPPAFDFFTLSALICSEVVLIPFDCDEFARQALYQLLDNVKEASYDHNSRLKVGGIIINQFVKRALLPSRLIHELVAEGLPVFRSYLSNSVKMRESHQESLPIIHMAPGHRLTQEFLQLFNEMQTLLQREHKTGTNSSSRFIEMGI